MLYKNNKLLFTLWYNLTLQTNNEHHNTMFIKKTKLHANSLLQHLLTLILFLLLNMLKKFNEHHDLNMNVQSIYYNLMNIVIVSEMFIKFLKILSSLDIIFYPQKNHMSLSEFMDLLRHEGFIAILPLTSRASDN